jgi:hypothetical protein
MTDHHIGYLRVRNIRITTDPLQAIALDGENLEPAPVSFKIVPASLQVVATRDRVVARREQLTGLPGLAILAQTGEPLESLVLNYEPPLDFGQIFTEIATELGRALFRLREAGERAFEALVESAGKILLQVLRALARELDRSIEWFFPISLSEEKNEAIEVVHRIPGRFRLRVPRIRHDEIYRERVRSLRSDRIDSIEMNIAAASIAVTYPADFSGESIEREFLTLLGQIA